MADYNYDNIPENNDFDQSYGQNLLSARNRQAKIVSPMRALRSPNYTSLRNSATKRENEKEKLGSEKKSEASSNENSNNASNKEAKSNNTPVNNAKNLGKVADKLASGKKAAKTAEVFLKAKKFKLILIGGGILFGLLLVMAIFFAVFSGGGSEMTGASFNEVSEYETSKDDEEYDEEYGDEWDDSSEQE